MTDCEAVYTNSLLATLNARKSIANAVEDINHMLVSLPPSTPAGSIGAVEVLQTSRSASKKGTTTPRNISIRIDTTKESIHEERDIDGMGSMAARKSEEEIETKMPPL
ncbi:hypothetical protein H0H81_001037 [Sphagnurus paluster]|uniref:Uncharacterized protein n=1 Tax=Sphagnurus paluster TaxID=117069 RepID=A0A9P7K4C1_9AGAR|nr:hypothetical protein H0H81_001037 [Sphagnurus paluster]